MLTDEMRYKLMRLVEANPRISQREAARTLGMSLGKVNFCLQSLMHKGLIKATRFKNSRNKAAYLYVLTPHGIEAKAKLTVRFLRAKMQEYAALRAEIEQIRRDAAEGATRPR